MNNDYGKLDKSLGSTAFTKDRGSLLIQKCLNDICRRIINPGKEVRTCLIR